VLIDAMNGRHRWSTRQAAAHSHLTWGSRTSLSVANGTAYTLGEHVSAIAVHNGRLRWQHPSPSTRHRRVLVAGESVVCVAGGQVFVTYRARDGERLWQMQAQHRPIESMVLMEPTVYIGEGYTPSGFTITACDVLTGEVRWVWPHSDQAEHPGRSDISWRFVGADDILYVPGPQAICAIRGSDGEQLWTWPTHDGIPAMVAVPAARS
jgi:outer membrane protein assembly factor BamB